MASFCGSPARKTSVLVQAADLREKKLWTFLLTWLFAVFESKLMGDIGMFDNAVVLPDRFELHVQEPLRGRAWQSFANS